MTTNVKKYDLMFKKRIVEGLENQHVDDRKVLVTRNVFNNYSCIEHFNFANAKKTLLQK